MVILENIDIDIDIDKAILQNIDIDKISNRFKFCISNRASQDWLFYRFFFNLQITEIFVFSLEFYEFDLFSRMTQMSDKCLLCKLRKT